jgi:hypothetical protein
MLRALRAASSGRRAWIVVGALGFAAAAGVVGALVMGPHPAEVHVDESKLPRLPVPETLPPVGMPRFKYAHPRLPAQAPPTLRRLPLATRISLRQVRARAGVAR